MKIGFFTDTYFPQVSGVATSIKTLKKELEKMGHEVFIFTTTDPNAPEDEAGIIRMPSVPFVSFKDRRIVVRGMREAYLLAKELDLDLIHTHTEFGTGLLGKFVGKRLEIPVIHTYHTMYEDYLHYIANGKVFRPAHVRFLSRIFANHTTGVVCPSERVSQTLADYGVITPMRIIPTGIDIKRFESTEQTASQIQELRKSLGLAKDDIFLLSLSRISYEKNIQALIQHFPEVLEEKSNARLVIVGKGPYEEELKKMITELEIADKVIFVGEVPNNEVARFYQAADYFVSTSTSESQGLTYLEALASGTQVVVEGNVYLDQLVDDESLGTTFIKDEDFAPALLAYIDKKIKVDPQILSRKRAEISAETFGLAMIDFYNDMLIYYQKIIAEKKVLEHHQVKAKHKRSFRKTTH
ncbi:MAG TPA: glycosyltransferase family 4 protein [Tetragenococcus sp.]|nr:glycosyltransferase family 4 protein [Tetragenococcus sp.]